MQNVQNSILPPPRFFKTPKPAPNYIIDDGDDDDNDAKDEYWLLYARHA